MPRFSAACEDSESAAYALWNASRPSMMWPCSNSPLPFIASRCAAPEGSRCAPGMSEDVCAPQAVAPNKTRSVEIRMKRDRGMRVGGGGGGGWGGAGGRAGGGVGGGGRRRPRGAPRQGCLRLERLPAAAAAGRVGILDLEAAGAERLLEVDLRAVQKRQALGVDHERETVRLELLVAGLRIVEHHVVLITGAASGDRTDAQGLAGITFLLLDAAEPLGCRGRHRDHHTIPFDGAIRAA